LDFLVFFGALFPGDILAAQEFLFSGENKGAGVKNVLLELWTYAIALQHHHRLYLQLETHRQDPSGL